MALCDFTLQLLLDTDALAGDEDKFGDRWEEDRSCWLLRGDEQLVPVALFEGLVDLVVFDLEGLDCLGRDTFGVFCSLTLYSRVALMAPLIISSLYRFHLSRSASFSFFGLLILPFNTGGEDRSFGFFDFFREGEGGGDGEGDERSEIEEEAGEGDDEEIMESFFLGRSLREVDLEVDTFAGEVSLPVDDELLRCPLTS